MHEALDDPDGVGEAVEVLVVEVVPPLSGEGVADGDALAVADGDGLAVGLGLAVGSASGVDRSTRAIDSETGGGCPPVSRRPRSPP